jgi:thioredoxin reductase (NADPH)
MKRYDLCIIGAGPCGLSAAINASSEGLDTLLIDADKEVGGQSRYSAAIENFIGFPSGITGEQFSHFALKQARKFKTQVLTGHRVASLSADEKDRVVTTSEGLNAVARCVLIACGLQWRKLEIDGADEFQNSLLYGGMKSLAPHYSKKQVLIIGGGNSAGQAAIRWAKYANVSLVVREPLEHTMSHYLIQSIAEMSISVLVGRELKRLLGEAGHLKTCILDSGEMLCDAVIPMIGSVPQTGFALDVCNCDEHGYIIDGKLPGFLAAGDCRKDSIKRIAVAVGEGSSAIANVHKYLN